MKLNQMNLTSRKCKNKIFKSLNKIFKKKFKLKI